MTCSVQCSSVAQSCLTLHIPKNCSTPGFPVYHQLQEFAQTHVHWVSDAIQPSHPLLFPSPPAFNLSQDQGLFYQCFASGGQSIRASASVLPTNIQEWFPLGLTGLISLQSKGLSRVFSNTTVQKHEFFWSPSSLLTFKGNTFSSVQFSHSVVSDSWRPHESQHTRWWPIIGLGISTLSHT